MSGELRFYVERLDQLRETMREVLLGLDSDGLNWKPLPDTSNSIYNLAQHSAWTEQGLISRDLAGEPYPYEWQDNEDLEGAGEDAADLLFWLDEAATTTGAALRRIDPSTLDDPIAVQRGERTIHRTPRWIVVRVIEHYAEHIGQMQLTRQLWDASEKAESRW